MSHTFTGVIEASDRGGAFVPVPFDVEEAFGSKKPPIRALIDGIEYRGSLVRMGTPYHILIVRKDIRKKISKEPGDAVEVEVALDDAPRVVEVPDDLMAALEPHDEARSFFDGLSYTHRKEYVSWITEAKRATTRERRIAKAVEMLREGKASR